MGDGKAYDKTLNNMGDHKKQKDIVTLGVSVIVFFFCEHQVYLFKNNQMKNEMLSTMT